MGDSHFNTPRVPHNGGHLFWIRSDLARERNFHPEDCFPVSRSQRIAKPPVTVSFARGIWERGFERATYVEIVKWSSMVEGGHWIWQADKLRVPGRGKS
jgi:hypothetical protein